MAAPQPTLTPSPSSAEAPQIVTLTVYSSGSATQSGLPALSSGGGTSVPVAAIVGGAVGGMSLAVLLVIIWNYWGRTIKRTERKRRKEMQDMLTIRENTRRNATSGFRPQSQYRPMFELNRESRRVTFLAGTPTLQLRASNDNDNERPSAPAQTEGEKGQNEIAHAQAPDGSGDIGTMDEIRQLSPNFASSSTRLLEHDAVPAGAAVGPERKSESGERPSLEREPETGESTEPSISPPPPRQSTPSPPPVPSSSTHPSPMRAPSPTPSGSESKETASPRPSRSVRMQPRPSLDPSLPRSSSIGSSRTYRTYDSGMRSTSPTPLLPPLPPVPVLPVTATPSAAEPSASSSSSSSVPPSQASWSRSPLRNSVLPSDNPALALDIGWWRVIEGPPW
ncbi:hypothetical protein BGY98DRAFT_1099930 [Russula aff. rugulosa BPL654]|nr:hypothetical protein BGY98DRAFT_1099930 [Russula aff. rugulosa BPL654]